jgi:EmrB/QacA subfamily drug resistance transporter
MQPAVPSPTPATSARRWWALAALSLAQLVVVLDATIVNVALPQAQIELGLEDGQRQWVITAYVLAFGALLLLGGRIADYWGRKRSFVVGTVGFAAASLWGGLAQSSGELVAARGVQGAFAALLAPAALSLVTVTFVSGRDRSIAFTVFGTVSATGAAIGFALGGVLTELVGWRWCLLVNVVLAAVVLLGALLLRESRSSGPRRYDLPGAVLITLGLGSVVYGFAQAEHGWASPVVVGCLAAGAALIALFVVVESRVAQPLLPLRVLADRSRAGALLVQAFVGAIFIGSSVYIAFHLQIVLGLSPLEAGIGNLAMTGAILLVAPLVANLLGRIGPRVVMTVGPLVAAVGMVLLSRLSVDGTYWTDAFLGLVVAGVGMAFVTIPMQNVALIGIDGRDAGAAAAVVTSSMQIGGSIGLAIFTSVFVSVGGGHAAAPTDLSGYSAVYLASAVALVAAALVAVTLVRRRMPAPEELPAEALLVH